MLKTEKGVITSNNRTFNLNNTHQPTMANQQEKLVPGSWSPVNKFV